MRGSLLRIREMVRKEVRQLLRDPKTKRIMFISPIIQLLLFGYAVNTDVHETALFVVDHDQSADSRTLIDALTAADRFRVMGRSRNPRDLADALDRGDAVVGVQVPPGYSRDLRAGDGARVQFLFDGTNSNTATIAQGYANRITQQLALDYATSAGRLPAGGVELRARAWYNPALESRSYNVPAVVGALLMLMSLLLTSLAVVREREIGTLEQLVVTPLTPGELIIGKTLPVALIALFDLVVVVLVAVLWFDVPFRGSPITLAAAAVLFIVSGLAMGLLISTVSSTQQEAFMTMFLIFFPLIILSGFLYPVSAMPEFFRALTLLNPLRHFLEIVRGVFLKGEGFVDLGPQFGALAVMAAVGLWAAVWRFRARVQ